MPEARTLWVPEVPPKIRALVQDADHVGTACNQTAKQNMGACGPILTHASKR
jgi:hypothetical protein